MSVEVDLDVEAQYLPSDDGEHGIFLFSLPHATISIRMEANDLGSTDAAILVENLEHIWRNTLEKMLAGDLTDPE